LTKTKEKILIFRARGNNYFYATGARL
jgi:hypothetical protein